MSNIKRFSSRKEVTEFLKEKGIDTSNWSEEKWLSLNKGQAEIHMMALAECIYDAMNESTPKQLQAGEWHIPFEDKMDDEYIQEELVEELPRFSQRYKAFIEQKVKVSTAMAARTSYTVVGDEKEINYQKMIELHDRLIEMRHDSPLEHCARVMSDNEYNNSFKGQEKGWFRNYKGFKSYRQVIEE